MAKESIKPTKEEEGMLGRDKILLKRLDKVQEEMRVMHLRNKKANKKNTRMLDAHDETLKNVAKQMQHLYCSCAQKQQEAFVEDNELNKEDSELYSVVTLRSGRQLGAQKNKEQRANKVVKDDDEE